MSTKPSRPDASRPMAGEPARRARLVALAALLLLAALVVVSESRRAPLTNPAARERRVTQRAPGTSPGRREPDRSATASQGARACGERPSSTPTPVEPRFPPPAMPALSGKPFAGGPANPVDDSELLLSVSERRAAEEERREEQARLARPDSPCPADTPAQEAAMDALAEQRARERRVLPEPVEGEPDHPWRPRAPDADSESR